MPPRSEMSYESWQKPRHVPSFYPVVNTHLERLLLDVSSKNDLDMALQRYELGTIGLRRYAAIHKDEIDAKIEDFSKRMTRLASDATERPVIALGFSGRSKRWTLCPASDCISKAEKREKIVCQWKILWFSMDRSEFIIPSSVYDAYSPIVDNESYFAATVCPQQTYCSKHSTEIAFMDPNWHLSCRHQYSMYDVLLFCDPQQQIRVAWRLRTLRDKYKAGGDEAEKALIRIMNAAFRFFQHTALNPDWSILNQPKDTLPSYNQDYQAVSLSPFTTDTTFDSLPPASPFLSSLVALNLPYPQSERTQDLPSNRFDPYSGSLLK